MKYLKIDDNKGYFTIDGTTWKPIDQINKNGLLILLDRALEDGFEMDEFEDEKIANPAHQIIYKNLYERFSEITRNLNRFSDESQNIYKDAISKYSQQKS